LLYKELAKRLKTADFGLPGNARLSCTYFSACPEDNARARPQRPFATPRRATPGRNRWTGPENKIVTAVSQYKKIVALYENGPSKIAVTSFTLKDPNCYYEGEASLPGKRKDRHGDYEYYEKGSGKLYVTDKDIQIMIDGHTVIGIDKIASLELDGDITSNSFRQENAVIYKGV
jgi:hypothetical protein